VILLLKESSLIHVSNIKSSSYYVLYDDSNPTWIRRQERCGIMTSIMN
jgi:hypothetical protein